MPTLTPYSKARDGERWSVEEEAWLYDAFVRGVSMDDTLVALARKPGGVLGRLRKLGLVDDKRRPVTPFPPFAPTTRVSDPSFESRAARDKADSEEPAPIVDETDRCQEGPHSRLMGPAALDELPVESGFEWPSHGCLPIATWFVAQVVSLLQSRVSEEVFRVTCHFLGWGTGEASLSMAELARRTGRTERALNRMFDKAMRMVACCALEGDWGAWPAHRVARALLLNECDKVDDQLVIVMAEGMYGWANSGPATVLWMLTDPKMRPASARRRLEERRQWMRDGRGPRAKGVRRRMRRSSLMWLGAWLPRQLNFELRVAQLSSGPVRVPSGLGVGHTGELCSERFSRTFSHESMEELRILESLDADPRVSNIEVQPLRIPLSEGHSYCPDIAIETADGVTAIVEVKVGEMMASEPGLVRLQAGLQLAQQRGCAFVLVDKRGSKLADLFAVEVDDVLRARVLERLGHRRVLAWSDLKDLVGPSSSAPFGALALQNDLSYTRLPHVRLSRLADGLSWCAVVRLDRRLRHGMGVRGDGVEALKRYW